MGQYKSTITPGFFINTDTGFLVSSDPAAEDNIAFAAWLAAGNTPDPFIPQSVTPRQARLALLGAGLLDQVTAAVNAAGGATLITWEYASVFNRNEPLIASIGESLNLTSDQIDQLFITAAGL